MSLERNSIGINICHQVKIMDKELAVTKFLADSCEATLKAFLQMNPMEKLEAIKQTFMKRCKNSQLNSLLDDTINNLKIYDSCNDSLDKWQASNELILGGIKKFEEVYFEHFLHFITLRVIFTSPYSPIDKKDRNEFKDKYELNPIQINQEFSKIFNNWFPKEKKQGGRKRLWNDREMLKFLAVYNRFLIVINNARDDIKLKGKGEREIIAERRILLKYEIPATLHEETFLDTTRPHDLALQWAGQEMKVEKEGYLADILEEARKVWRSKRKFFSGINGTTEKLEKRLDLIDINFQVGCRYYAVDKVDRKKTCKLKYVSVAKELKGSMKLGFEEHYEEFLVGWTL